MRIGPVQLLLTPDTRGLRSKLALAIDRLIGQVAVSGTRPVPTDIYLE
jgi:hypothetical protein